jgi:Leucine-rich repeat (LRR) protein
MSLILIIGLILFFSINEYIYASGIVTGKKVYTNLNEALKEKKRVYNLKLSNQKIDLDQLRQIGELINLRFLDIESCHLKSMPDEIFKLPDLKTLILNYNDFTAIPAGIKYCKGLEYFSLIACNLTSIPKEIGELSNLETFIIKLNEISTLAPEIGKLKKLTYLALSYNQIEVLPDQIGELKKLKNLHLTGCKLKFLPVTIGNCTNLAELEVDDNSLTTLPVEIGNLKSLANLDASGNSLKSIPSSLGRLTKLEILNFKDNKIISFPDELSNLKNLIRLSIGGYSLSQFPEFIRGLSKLESLEIKFSPIRNIPDFICELTHLRELSFSTNKITSLPDCLWQLQSLTRLALIDNGLITIPSVVFKIMNLETLDFSFNPISDIPAEIENFKKLKILDIYATSLPEERVKEIKKRVPPGCKVFCGCDADIDSTCKNVFCDLQEPPVLVNNYKNGFKKTISTKIDTLQFVGHGIGSFILNFIVNRLGDVDSVTVIESNFILSDTIRAILPSLGKWHPGNQEGKIICVYVTLKFEFTNESWTVKRLNPCTMLEDKRMFFKQ